MESERFSAPIYQGIIDQLLIPECISPRSDLSLEHREAALTMSQRQNAMLVTRFGSGDDKMVSIALDFPLPYRLSTPS
jgi:hypothetical protein